LRKAGQHWLFSVLWKRPVQHHFPDSLNCGKPFPLPEKMTEKGGKMTAQQGKITLKRGKVIQGAGKTVPGRKKMTEEGEKMTE
jgi:hypothetical protein